MKKKVINGKMYNTETAKEIAYHSNSRTGFEHCEETLYRKKTGEYFLHGSGGPMSKYAEAVDTNSWSGGSDIVPLTIKEAAAWGEKNMSPDDYEAEFGLVPEDDSQELVGYRISVEAAELVRRESRATGRTVSQVVDALIIAALRQ